MNDQNIMVAPAVRTVAIEAWSCEDGGDYQILPVLAIVGYLDRGSGVNVYDVIVVSDVFGRPAPVQFFRDVVDGTNNLEVEVVVCDWDQSEDEKRLSPIAHRLRQEAQVRLRSKLASKQ